MKNPQTTILIDALEKLAQKTESVVSDFSIIQLVDEVLDAIRPLAEDYEWFTEQSGWLVDAQVFESYDPVAPNHEETKKKVLKELNRLSYVTANVSGVTALLPAKISVPNILTGELTEDQYLVLLYSLRQTFVPEYRHEVVLQFVDFVKKNSEKIPNILASDKRVLFILFLDLVWLDLSKLSSEMVRYVVSNFFRQSLQFFCPVEIGLTNFLSLATSLDEYETKRALIGKSLTDNQEKIAGTQVLLSEFYTSHGEDTWLAANASVFTEPSLSVAVQIFDALNAAKLGRPFSGEDSVGTEFDMQLVQLAAWFLEYESWGKIIKNFLQENPLVSVKVFISNLAATFDLNAPEAIEVITKFQDLCRVNKVLAEDQELFFWDQNTGLFEWNSEFLI